MTKTAAELMAELANDRSYQAMKAEKKQEIDELKTIYEQDEKTLIRDINNCGFSVKSVWDFVNSKNDYLDAIPVLMNHLKMKHHPKILAGIARSLAISTLANNDKLWFALTELYGMTLSDKQIPKPENRGAQEAIAVALEALASSSRVVDLDLIIKEQPNGDGIDWLKEKLISLKKK